MHCRVHADCLACRTPPPCNALNWNRSQSVMARYHGKTQNTFHTDFLKCLLKELPGYNFDKYILDDDNDGIYDNAMFKKFLSSTYYIS